MRTLTVDEPGIAATGSSRPVPGKAWTLAVLALMGAAGCSERSPEEVSRQVPAAAEDTGAIELPGVVVSTVWLWENRDREGLVILDARAPAQYAEGHIPGAVNMPRRRTYNPAPERSNLMAPPQRIAEVLGEAGVGNDSVVVVYDDANYRDAARLFWVLEANGHRRAAVLDGGLGRWSEEGRPVSTQPTVPEPARFEADLDPRRWAGRVDVLRAIENPNRAVLDVRSREEYVGATSPASRAGHIPSAIHLPFSESFTTEESYCDFKEKEELLQVYRGIPDGGPVITYCNTGTRASVVYLALRSQGREVAVYDGSWMDWGNDPILPIETGEPAVESGEPEAPEAGAPFGDGSAVSRPGG